MIDREKVIKGLECCADGDCKGQECPYHHNLPEDWNKFDCNTELARDALKLLMAQDRVRPEVLIDTYVCGKCRTKLERQQLIGPNVLIDERFKYCPNCGSEVFWNETD